MMTSMQRLTAVVVTARCMLPIDAVAQTQLPGITVTTPSPIAATPRQKPITGIQSSQDAVPPPANTVAAPSVASTLAVEPGFAAVTVLSGPELLANPAPTLGDALAGQPGIAATGFAPGASRPVIRGLSGFRVSVQENGLGTGDVQKLSNDHAVPLDPLAAEQIEVVRGPATLRFGSQAIGGVVNATNSRIPDAIPENGWRAKTKGQLNSVNNGRDGAALVEAGAGHWVVHADAFERSADDYRIPGGRQANTSYSSDGYSLGTSYVFRDGFLGVAYSSFASTYFIPGIEAAAAKNHISLDQTKWTSRGEWRVNDFGISAVRLWMGYLDYKHDEIDGIGADQTIGSTFLNKQYEARVEVEHQLLQTALGQVRGAAGFQWTDRKLSASGADGILLDPTSTRTIAGYVFEELQLSKPLKLQAAARLERSNVDGTASRFPPSLLPPPDEPEQSPSGRTFLPKSGSLGLLYTLPLGVVARATLQHTERAPDATELFYKGPHDSTQTFEIGNPDLKIEQGDTLEIGLKKSHGEFRFDLSAYRTRFRDFIYKRFTNQKCDSDFASCGTGSELDQIAYDQRNATFTGAEVQSELDIGRVWAGVWGIEARYDFVNARFDDGSYVPKISPHRAGGGFYYRDAHWLARVNLLHAFAQTHFADFETRTSGYNLLNAELSYRMPMEPWNGTRGDFTIGIKGENLLNDDIRNHVSYKKDEVLQPGASVMLFGTVELR